MPSLLNPNFNKAEPIIRLKKLFLTSVLVMLLIPAFHEKPVEAHFLPYGVNHNTFLTKSGDDVLLYYDLILFYTDLDILYEQVDSDSNGDISWDDTQAWLEKLKTNLYINLGEYTYQPTEIRDFSDYNDIKNDLYPKVEFTVVFQNLKIPDTSTEFKLMNRYRIESNDPQDWNFAHDPQSIKLTSISITDNSEMSAMIHPYREIAGVNSVSTQQINTEENLFENSNLTGILAQPRSTLQSLLSDRSFSTVTLIYIFALSFVFGMAHTLTPGHGKSVISAYMLSIKGSLADAAIMAVSTVISHTGVVIAVGLIFVLLRRGLTFVIPFIDFPIALPSVSLREVVPVFTTISGISLIFIGFWLFRRRLLEFIHTRVHRNHDHHQNPDSHDPKQDHHTHNHSHYGHTHEIPHKRISLKESISLGISTGLNPCIDAIAILILAMNLNEPLMGILIILVFSLGMALTLIVIGWSIGRGITFGEKRFRGTATITEWLPMISSLFVALTGILLVI